MASQSDLILQHDQLQLQFNEFYYQNELLLVQLIELGFEPYRIQRVLHQTGASTIDGALSFLIKGSQGWEHDFRPEHPLSATCIICEEPLNQHNTPMNQAFPYEQDIMPIQNAAQVNNSQHCEICYNQISEATMLCPSHEFCQACLRGYIQNKINHGQIEMHCPAARCAYKLTEQNIQSLVNDATMQKYYKFQRQHAINNNPNTIHCCTPDCEGVLYKRANTNITECNICRGQMCFNCKNKWHPKQSCDQVVDQDYASWAKDKDVSVCPNCKRRVEKLDGCNHMTCAGCSYQWCWLCRGKYYSNHYSPHNPFGCPRMQSGTFTRSNTSLRKIYMKRIGLFLLYLIGALIGIPFGLVFGPTVVAIIWVNSRVYQRRAKVPLIVLCLVLVPVLTPLIYLLLAQLGLFRLARKIFRRNYDLELPI